MGGYDKTPSALTEALEQEGAIIHYEDDVQLIPAECLEKENCLVVYTPAIPSSHKEWNFFKEKGFNIIAVKVIYFFFLYEEEQCKVDGTA